MPRIYGDRLSQEYQTLISEGSSHSIATRQFGAEASGHLVRMLRLTLNLLRQPVLSNSMNGFFAQLRDFVANHGIEFDGETTQLYVFDLHLV